MVVRKDLEITEGQRNLPDWNNQHLLYITNYKSETAAREQVEFKANRHCNQENIIEPLKNGIRVIRTPFATLESNRAFIG